uniref:LIM domain only protein 7 n=1 Tax=Haemonchus contortus TaxID=6289 RepID=A0A7I4YAW8_HAECO
MDANTKVTKYLADLSHDGGRPRKDKDSHTHVNTTALQTIRGPGQAAHDPLQFVSTSAISMAESARQLINITEQQKRERAKLVQHGGPINYDESWQEDLDTWRRKRKTKVAKQDSVDNTSGASAKDYSPAPKEYHSLPGYGRMHKETKEEILTIHSPSSHQEDLNDSGIENRTTDSHSPSTSLDFSPRSDSKLTSDPISPKHTTYTTETSESRTEQPPDYAPPPPPPPPSSLPSDSLDQVVIPLSVSRSTTSTPPKTEEDDYPPPPPHLRRHHFSGDRSVQELSSRFETVSADIKSPSTRFEERTSAKPYTEYKDNHSVDLTVELNREQRGQGTTFISHISHHIQPPPPLTTTAASRTATVSGQSSTSPERHRVMPPTTAYRTVDIPFDESPAAYQPKKDENVRTVTVTMGTHPVQKGLGFSITIERGRPTIDSVIVSSPADRAGLLIGDRVISINGEDLKDKYPSAINRMLHEAARLGEAEVCIERKDAKIAQVKSITSVENFDKVRSVFTEKTIDSYAEFKRKHSRAPRTDHPSPREYNSLPRSTSAGVIPQSRRDSSISASQRSAAVSPSRSYFDSRTTTRTEYRSVNGSSDYKVTSMHEKTGPGKLTDFVPESERAAAKAAEDEKKEYSYRRASEEEPRLIRNYDLPPAKPATTRVTPIPVTTSPFAAPRRISTENESVSAVPKRSTLPRDTHIHEESRHLEDDTVAGRSYLESRDWRDVIDQQRQPAPGYAPDTRRIRDASASLGNLPAIINRKLEETRKLEKERQTTEYGYRSFDSRREPLHGASSHTEAYDRSADYGRFEKSYTPDYRTRHYDSSRYGAAEARGTAATAADSSFASDYRRREQRELSPSSGYGRREMSAAFREEIHREPVTNEQVVAVSGKHRCAHCADELGRGAAMIIESLNLFYHLSCFKCYVCKTPLGSGATGADVRVREGRLHCQSCYSNDRLQLSKV